MKYILILLLLIPISAEAKAFKVENSEGKLVRCGDWINTPGAAVIRNCPKLGDFLMGGEPTPIPTKTPEPTTVPLHCDATFTRTTNGQQIAGATYELDKQYTLCFSITSTTGLKFFEINTVNHTNAFCSVYEMTYISPSGKSFTTTGPSPVLRPDKEIGKWYLLLKQIAMCDELKPFSIFIS